MIETHAVPTVTFCTNPFRTLAQVRRETLGLPQLPIVFLPHPMMTKNKAEIDQLVEEVFQDVVQKLTEQPS